MPMDRTRYPANWDEIAISIKERAGWKCEQCGVEHDTVILRDKANYNDWHYATDGEMEDGGKHLVHVVLTVHHKGVDYPDGGKGDPEDKMDNRPENLAALCQRCHLIADLATHQANAKQTRIRKKRQQQRGAGQAEMF